MREADGRSKSAGARGCPEIRCSPGTENASPLNICFFNERWTPSAVVALQHARHCGTPTGTRRALIREIMYFQLGVACVAPHHPQVPQVLQQHKQAARIAAAPVNLTVVLRELVPDAPFPDRPPHRMPAMAAAEPLAHCRKPASAHFSTLIT